MNRKRVLLPSREAVDRLHIFHQQTGNVAHRQFIRECVSVRVIDLQPNFTCWERRRTKTSARYGQGCHVSQTTLFGCGARVSFDFARSTCATASTLFNFFACVYSHSMHLLISGKRPRPLPTRFLRLKFFKPRSARQFSACSVFIRKNGIRTDNAAAARLFVISQTNSGLPFPLALRQYFEPPNVFCSTSIASNDA